MTDIAIIGGGAAGAAVFGALLGRDDGPALHWITGRSLAGRGVAYATTDDHHLLNVRAASMGLFVDQDEDFVQHASRSVGDVRGTDFLPRRLFGDFIDAQVNARAERALRRGRRFDVHAKEALRVEPSGLGYNVYLADGEMLHVGTVILAVGALSPRPLRTVSELALTSGAYELDPWRLQERTHAPHRLLVIGTGLTAVDTLLSAATRWPHAELVAVSRHGLLPFVHPPLPLEAYPLQAELNATLLASHGVASMLRRVRAAIQASPHTDWRSIIDGLRPINARLWQGFTLAQRRQFLRHVRWVWEASRHRTALRSGETIQQLRDEGRLQVYEARVLSVDGRGPLDVAVRTRASQLRTTLQADLVVQATGLDTAVAFAEHALLSQLLQDGLAVADPLKLGVVAHADGRLIDAHGNAQHGLYAMGSLLRGNLWECTAMPEIRMAAHALAENWRHNMYRKRSPIDVFLAWLAYNAKIRRLDIHLNGVSAMNKLLLAALGLACLPLHAAEPANPVTVADALQNASQQHRPVLLDFQAVWCYSCYYMASHVLNGAQWAAVENKAIVVQVDADSPEGQAWMTKLKVTFLPSYVVLNERGVELGRILAEQPRQKFYTTMDGILATGNTLDALKRKSTAGSLDATAAVLDSYQARDDGAGGLAWFATLPNPLRNAAAKNEKVALGLERLKLSKAVAAKDDNAVIVSAQKVLDGNIGCDRPYVLDDLLQASEKIPTAQRTALLAQQRKPLDHYLATNIFVPAPTCADQRSAVVVSADLDAALGDHAAEKIVLDRAIDLTKQRLGKNLASDRNMADNLRAYLARAQRTAELDAYQQELIAAYPDDYVYAYRYGRSLLEQGRPADALPWLEKASDKAYGVNRLTVAGYRVKALKALNRQADAEKVVSDVLKDNGQWFPVQVAQLKAKLNS